MDSFVLRKQAFEPHFSQGLAVFSLLSFAALVVVSGFSMISELTMVLLAILGGYGVRNAAFYHRGEYPVKMELGDSMVIASANGKKERINYKDIRAVDSESYNVAGNFLTISLRNGEERGFGIFEKKEREMVAAIKRRVGQTAA